MANIIESTVVNVRVGVKSALESLESKGSKSKPKAKYEVLTGKKHTVVVDGVTYCRIRALRGFDRPFGLPPVEPGDLGGFVAVTRWGSMLSQDGSCWVADEAFVAGRVSGNSQVVGHAFVGAGSKVTGKSLISDYAQVIDGAEVQDSLVTDYAQVVGVVRDSVKLEYRSGEVSTGVFGYSCVSGRARVCNGARVYRFSRVGGSAVVAGHVRLRKGSIVNSVVLVGEHEVIDLSGEVIDEPMNRWGFPTAVVSRAGDEPVRSVKHFSEPEFSCQLPFAGDGVPLPPIDTFDCSVVDSVRELADFFGVEADTVDGTACGWAGTYDKEDGFPRGIYKCQSTGIAYFSPETEEEERERLATNSERSTNSEQ